MVTRNIAATISIGGAVASSLPSSVKRASTELDRLRVVQKANVQESRVLRDRLRELTRAGQGQSEAANAVRLRQEELGRDIAQNAERMTELGIASRESAGGVQGLAGRLGGMRAALGPASVALGAVTGIVLGVAAALSKAGADANNLLITADRLGTTTDSLQYNTAYFRHFTQDANQARQAAESVAGVLQSFSRTRFGAGPGQEAFLAASRLRLDINDLVGGELDPQGFIQSVIAGLRDADLDPVEGRLRLEQLGIDPAVQGAILRAVEQGDAGATRNAERAYIQSREQLEANREIGTNIDEIRQRMGELIRAVIDRLVPPILAVARFFTDYQTPEQELAALQRVSNQRSATERLAPDVAGAAPNTVVQRVDRAFLPDANRIDGERTTGEDIAEFLKNALLTTVGITPRARGGRVRSGELTLVGEERPEIARFPAGTEIIPRARGGRVRGERPEIVRFPIPSEAVLNSTEQGMQQNQSGRMEGDRITIQQTIYLTVNQPGSDVDIERALQNAALATGTQTTVG